MTCARQTGCAAHPDAALAAVRAEIAQADGWIPFDRYLQIVLHSPHGFYGSGRVRFGPGGDFVTAPDISPLFAQMLALQVAQVLRSGGRDILELGAGDGRLSLALAQLLREKVGAHYILETAAPLKQRQEQTLAGEKITWLSSLPEQFNGVIIANEVLDAVPFSLFANRNGKWRVRGVSCPDGRLQWSERDCSDDKIISRLQQTELPDGSITEIAPQAEALSASLCSALDYGALLIADYGFVRREYYHPQRTGGTLMCHHNQRADSDPLAMPGDKDITAHVDFTGIAEAGTEAGAALAGYVTQAQFLINCGIAEVLEREARQRTSVEYARLAAGAQKLLSPHEMGELFKCMAFTKGDVPPLIGFQEGDQRHRL